MKWVKERDLLITQTMAFVQSITGKKSEIKTPPEARNAPTPVEIIEALERPVRIMPQVFHPMPVRRDQMREEIQGRVAAFRAHQRLFDRERDTYFNAVLKKARDSVGGELKRPGS